jgi:hypothetical protein
MVLQVPSAIARCSARGRARFIRVLPDSLFDRRRAAI